MSAAIHDLVGRFEGARVAVIGDVMLDEYLWGHIQRISPEAPTPILSLARQEATLGGTGNVAKNLRMLGADVSVLGAVGQDTMGGRILEMFNALGIDCSGVQRDPERQSTCKTRLVSIEHGQQVFRYDNESSHALPEKLETELLAALEVKVRNANVLLCSDYLKGVLSVRVLQEAIAIARRYGVPTIVAPKDSDPAKYRGATVLVPNLKELARVAGTAIDSDESLTAAARKTLEDLQIKSLLVTRGAEGMSLFEYQAGTVRRVDIATVAQAVYDVTGAGDTVVSVFALALAAGADQEAAARLANIAAGVVVSKRGTAWATAEEILKHLDEPGVAEAASSNRPSGRIGQPRR